MDKWIYPYFGDILLADVNNKVMKELVENMAAKLSELLREYIGNRTSGLLFQTSTGNQLLQANTLQDSLHPILKRLNHVKGGLNIFRRFRLTHVDKSECPQSLEHFWSGHAAQHVSERCIKLIDDLPVSAGLGREDRDGV